MTHKDDCRASQRRRSGAHASGHYCQSKNKTAIPGSINHGPLWREFHLDIANHNMWDSNQLTARGGHPRWAGMSRAPLGQGLYSVVSITFVPVPVGRPGQAWDGASPRGFLLYIWLQQWLVISWTAAYCISCVVFSSKVGQPSSVLTTTVPGLSLPLP